MTDLMGDIGVCPSTAHRSVLGLARVAMGRSFDGSLLTDLAASDPEEIARIAVFNYVHVVLAASLERAPELAAAVPRDLVIFFREMQSANQRRNHQILSQLRQVGATLADAGLHCVAMKGAAELLAPLHDEPAFRFLSDLDILVPEPHLGQAVDALRNIGAISDAVDDINARGHHHAAPLRHKDWLVQVELHRALAQGTAGSILGPEQVLEAAHPTDVRGLSVPSPTDRLTHAVLHAQFSPPRYRDAQLSLRDLLEMEILLRRLTRDEIATARARFFDTQADAAWSALDASRLMILGSSADIAGLSPASRVWAERALAAFGHPGRRRTSTLLRWLGWYAKEAVVNPERRAHYLRKSMRPGALTQTFAHHRDRWRRTR